MKGLFLFVILWSLVLGCFGQKYTGTVVNKVGSKPVDAVSLCLLSADSLVVGFCVTDADGRFVVEAQEDGQPPMYLSLQSLGFRRKVLKLSPDTYCYTVALEEEVYRMKDVKVSAQRIVEKKDTLVYSVSGFAQPQDKSIADVIAKMPGMEVKPDGQISFNGKAINKFYIEGMDLMGDRYALASGNLSRKRVKSVEVLRNHQPVELLRGKNFSEQAAVNLILEDNSKLNLTGSADIGMGASQHDFLYSDRLLVMLFGKHYQTLSIYKNDNTGVNLYDEISPVSLSDILGEKVTEELSLITPVSIQSPDIDRTWYIFNRSHLVATNHLFQLDAKSTIRTQISYFNDVSERSHVVETDYTFVDTLRTMYENHALKERRNRLDASMSLEVNRPKLYLKNESKGSFDWLTTASRSVWEHRGLNLSSSPDRKSFSDILDLKIPLSGDRYVSVASTHSYNHHPQRLSIFSGEMQRTDYASFQTQTAVSFRHRLFRMYADYEAGFDGVFQSLSSTLDHRSLIEKQVFGYSRPYMGVGLSYRNSVFHADAHVRLEWMKWRYGKRGATESEDRLHPDTKLFMRYAINGSSSVSLKYQYGQRIPDIRQTYDGDLYTSYRTIVNNAHVPEPEPSHRLVLQYQYSQPIKGLFFSVSAIGRDTKRHSAYVTSLSAEKHQLLIRKRIGAGYHAGMYMLTSRISQSFNSWKSFLVLSGSYIRNEDAQFRDNRLEDYGLDNYSVLLSYSARPFRFLSAELSSLWQQNRMRSATSGSHTSQFRHRINFTFPLTEHLLVSVEQSFHHAPETDTGSRFTDFRASYTYKRVEFQLKANNLFGKSVYEREFLSAIERSFYTYTLRPREWMASVTISL